MLAELTSKNQLTLPKSVPASIGPTEYFDVVAHEGQLILTPVRIQRGDAVRDANDQTFIELAAVGKADFPGGDGASTPA